jgi:hypothetical protein
MQQQGVTLNREFFQRESMLFAMLAERNKMIDSLLAQGQQLQEEIKSLRADNEGYKTQLELIGKRK